MPPRECRFDIMASAAEHCRARAADDADVGLCYRREKQYLFRHFTCNTSAMSGRCLIRLRPASIIYFTIAERRCCATLRGEAYRRHRRLPMPLRRAASAGIIIDAPRYALRAHVFAERRLLASFSMPPLDISSPPATSRGR